MKERSCDDLINEIEENGYIKKFQNREKRGNEIKVVKKFFICDFYQSIFFYFINSSRQSSKASPQQQVMQQQSMQLNQRSHRRVSNPLDKICSKLEISVKDAPDGSTLSKAVKLKIQKMIEKDEIRKLQVYLNKKVISYDMQIGIKSMKWNILHFAAKNNSQKVLKVIMARTYQQSAQKYKQLINSQTTEGYTPLMITVINFAHEALSLLLEMGGSDTQLTDNKKMTTYDLALNYKNESAIRELMSYESMNRKRGNFPNQELLLKPIDPQLYSEANCYSKMFECFVDCFLCFKNGQDDMIAEIGSDEDGQIQQKGFLQKSFNNNKLKSLLKYNEQALIDMVSIGNKDIESKYSIEWKRLTMAVNQKTVLFDCFQPFDICENNLIIANNLIIFQCLSDHTWLIRKMVRQLKKGESNNQNNSPHIHASNISDPPNQYAIEIYINDELKKITVDQHIPFLKQRQQPMFLSNTNQIWPQVLQKGLAKLYGSYMKLSEISPMTFVQNLTGSFTKSFNLEDGMCYLKDDRGQLINDKSIMGALQEFTAKGYVILLQGRQGTTLSPKNSPSSFKNYCYTILNFYQKGTKKLILVNCPYVLNSWKEKQKSEMMQLKLIKSHYNSHNQMCVWIQESQFGHFFKRVIISFTEQNMIRSQIKIRYLLQAEVQKQQSNKLMAVIESLTASAKKILSSKNIHQKSPKGMQQKQKRESAISNRSSVNNQSQLGSSISIGMQGLKHKLITKIVFVKFKIQHSKNTQSFSLAIKDNLTHQTCKINSFRGWIDGGSKDVTLDDFDPFCTDLVKIKQKKGEYLCMFEVQLPQLPLINESASVNSSFIAYGSKNNTDKQNLMTERQLKKSQLQDNQKRASLEMVKTIKKHELLVICWSQDNVHLEHIQKQFAVIDCMDSWRKNTIKNWSFIDKKQNGPQGDPYLKYVVQKFGQKMILLTKSTKTIKNSFKFQGDNSIGQKIKQIAHEGQITDIRSGITNEQTSLTQYSIQMDLLSDGEHAEFKYIVIQRKEQLLDQLDSMVFNLSAKK